MATVQKIWTFNSDQENFGLISNTGGGSGDVQWDSGEFLRFSYSHTATAEDLNIVAQLESSESWLDWGVPTGSTVTSIELTNVEFATETDGDGGLDTGLVTIRLLNNTGAVQIASLLSNYSLPVVDGNFVQYDNFYGTGGDGQQSVGASYQSPSTGLIVEIDFNYITTGSRATNLANWVDNITIDINYDPPASNTKYYLIT